MFSLKPSFNGYESSTLGKKYVIKCDAIGNILRNRLGTWEHVENPDWELGNMLRIHIGNMVGIPKSKEPSFLLPFQPPLIFLECFSK